VDPVIAMTLCGALALLLLWAGGHKLRAFGAFRVTLGDYRLLPAALTLPAAVLLVTVEIALGLALLAPALRTLAAAGAASLLALYTGAIAANLLRGRRDIDCGCAGPASRQSLHEWLLLRNGVLVVLALLAGLPVTPRPLIWLDGVTVAGGVAVLAALYASIDRLAANAPALARLRS
jgi:uncharacterized membrane protein